jgi:hypothetical protein
VGWRERSFTTKNSALGVGTIADVPLLARAILLRRSNAWLSNPGRSTFTVFPFAVPAEFGWVPFNRALGTVGAPRDERSIGKVSPVESRLTGSECSC